MSWRRSDPWIWKPVFPNLVLPDKVACSQDRVKLLLDQRIKMEELVKYLRVEWYHFQQDWPSGTLRVDFQSFQQNLLSFRLRALSLNHCLIVFSSVLLFLQCVIVLTVCVIAHCRQRQVCKFNFLLISQS